MKWRFLISGENNGPWNMAIDEAILNIHNQGLTLPTLRIFEWSPPAVSLGKLQEAEKIIDIEACKKFGIDIVRRPTGASAVLHKNELTYSVVSSNFFGMPLSLSESHKIINRGLISAYYYLGVKLDCVKNTERNITSLCFLRHGGTDLTFEGKKLIGSAWLSRQNSVLQHGSLPIAHDINIIFSIFQFPNPESKEKAIKKFQETTTCLSEIIPRIKIEDLKEAIPKGFEKGLDIALIAENLLPEEINEAKKLLPKYQNLLPGEKI